MLKLNGTKAISVGDITIEMFKSTLNIHYSILTKITYPSEMVVRQMT